jgi:hypothetical protein
MSSAANEPELRAKELAKELHRSLSAAEGVEPETRQALAVLLGDIDRLLAGPPAAGVSPPAPLRSASDDPHVDRLTEAAQRFQATHPTLAGTLEGLADALGRMGI